MAITVDGCTRTSLDIESLKAAPGGSSSTGTTGGVASTGGAVDVLGGTLSASGGSRSVGSAGTTTVSTDAGTLLKAVSVSSGVGFSCAVVTDGSVRCWGANDYGQLGDGSGIFSDVPVTVSNANGLTAVAAGDTHACARTASGTVLCWGANDHGQLGNGSTTNSTIPVAVEGLTGAIAITAGSAFSCALFADGTVQCWGSNLYGELGIGGTNSVDKSTFAVLVKGITNATQISAGGSHSCAVLSDGSIQCWGFNVDGEIGNISPGWVAAALEPIAVVNLTDALLVSAGGWHTCALVAGHYVKCWGAGGYGQLGNHTQSSGYQPVDVTEIHGTAVAISAGDSHTCATNADGTVYCWGSNSTGQLGNGTTTNWSSPILVTNLYGVQAVAAGYGHNCALLNDGSVHCWGDNYNGDLGNSSQLQSLIPVRVVGF